MRVAVLQCERLPSFVTWDIPDVAALFDDDRELLEAFAARGVDAEPVAWSRADVDWDAYDAAVVRSTWDYVDHVEAFLAAMSAIDASRCTLLNPVDVLHWNADKHYLDDLDRRGVPIVPLLRGTPGEAGRLAAACVEAGWDELVVKPAVGAGGAGVTRTDVPGLADALARFAPGTEVMVQPFAEEIQRSGELSVAFIGGAPSHGLRKRPAPADFRAHALYGATVERVEPTASELAEVLAMAGRLPFDLLYARFDVVPFRGRLAILELELVEPMLYFGRAPGSALTFADATIARLGRM